MPTPDPATESAQYSPERKTDPRLHPPDAAAYLHSLVIHFYLFVRFQIVPDHHALFPADQCGPHFYRREPVDVDMGDDVIREVERDISHIFMTVQVSLPGSDDGLRIRFDEVIHDGQIMRRKIPQHIHIVLEKPQVDPRRIVVIEIS